MRRSRLYPLAALLGAWALAWPDGKVVQVQKGDSYWRIAKRFSVDWKSLVEANRGRKLRSGDRIVIPGAPFSPAPSGPQFVWPVSGSVRQGYGLSDHIMNYGLRLDASSAKVVSSEGGTVSFVGPVRGLGKTVMIAHADGYVSVYGGIGETKAVAGQKFARGQAIGELAEKELFFSVFDEGDPMNPARLLGKSGG